jgi:DNA-binding NtrC family response regulator
MDDILTGKKILIVDDEPDVLEELKELIDMCIIDTAQNFETAQKFLNKNVYDVAIFDIMGVRGYDLLELASQKGIPALMLTAHALNPDNLVKSIKMGAQSYVPKDEIFNITTYLADILKAREKGLKKHVTWFVRLKQFFDNRFGPGWKQEHKEFWQEFDKIHLASIKEVEKIMYF